MIKKTIGLLVGVVAIFVVSYGYLVWQNNRAVAAPSRQDMVASWEKGVSWLMNNREAVLRDQNPILWWMVGQSAELTGDPRLQILFADFRRQYDLTNSRSVWQTFFNTSQYWGVNIPPANYAGMGDYQQYFLFTLTCGKEMAAQPVMVAQHDSDFCWKVHPASPACVTHQLMGYRFLQRIQCDRVPELEKKIAILQNSIEQHLTWDPRVVDVYIQRILMLADSGARERIKPRWLQRVLNAQLADGSWSNLQPLVPLGGGRYFGFDAKLAGVGPVKGNFHATAQGLWLTSLLQGQAAAGSDVLSKN
jgi:hypothetical protein